MDNIGLIILLLFGITFLAVISNKYKFPFPIVLVLSGVATSLVPGLPVISLDPDIVFLIFLPPLLYSAAWLTSWHEFKANRRPITMAAFGLVLFTTGLVAVAAYYIIPGMSWPLAFLLGAIVSPPDAVAATSITKGLGLQPRIIAILEGESLVNDASGLIAYKYALAAVSVGNFMFWEAGLNFIVVVTAGVAIGLLIAFIMRQVHKRFICDPVIEVTLTFLTPFAAYLLAEHFEVSGVLAVVSCGLYLSFYSAEIFSHQSRIMTYSVWEVVVFILNGLIFILIGLQLRSILAGIHDYSTSELLVYGIIISLVVILVRFLWALPSLTIARFLTRHSQQPVSSDPRNIVLFGWAGMRGVVSMAAALALPLTINDTTIAFPERNLIIYLTFCVILSTLVLLGFTLPWVIRKMKLEPYSVVAEEYTIRTRLVSNTIAYIEENLSLVNDDILNNIKSKYEIKYNRLQRTELPANYFGKKAATTEDLFNEFSQLQIQLITVERKELEQFHRNGSVSEEILRKIERELDLEETRLKLELYIQ